MKITPRIPTGPFFLGFERDSNEAMPWDARSLPWPGVSRSRYVVRFLAASSRVGSFNERYLLEPMDTVGGRVTGTKEETWEVCVSRGGF